MATEPSGPDVPRRSVAAWFVDRIELSRGTKGHNVKPMEGLRGVAVFLVFIVHYATLSGPHIQTSSLAVVAEGMHTVGNRGVDLFFVLSGYLIYGSLMGRSQRFGTFLLRRIERIHPTFLFVFAIYVVLATLTPAARLIPGAPLQAALYLVANVLLLPGLFPIEPLVTVAWSLSYELFYYIAIPLLIAGLRLRSKSRGFRVALFASLAAALATYCFFSPGPIRLVMFVAGIGVYESINARRFHAPGVPVILVALAVAFSATLIPTLGSTGYMWKTLLLFTAFYALCLGCFEHPTSALSTALSATPLRWLGNMSYSYYLLHGLVLKVAFVVFEHAFPTTAWEPIVFYGMLPVMFAATLVPTAALFLFVEYPLSLSPQRPFHAPNAVELPTRGGPGGVRPVNEQAGSNAATT